MKILFKKVILILFVMFSLSNNKVYADTNITLISSDISFIDEKPIITKIYETSPEVNPDTLIESNIKDKIYEYVFDNIKKEELPYIDTKEETQTITIQSNTDDLNKNIKNFDSTIDYNQNGYTGKLYLDTKSIVTKATNYITKTNKINETKTYTNMAYNDPSLIPATIQKDGKLLTLSNIQWKEESLIQETSVPSSFTAIVTYTGQTNQKIPQRYTATAKYNGKITKKEISKIRYTITYKGNLIPIKNNISIYKKYLYVITLILLISIIILIFILMQQDKVVKIYARSEETGEYVLVQKTKLNKKLPIIELNLLKVPSSVNFIIFLKSKYAQKLFGKIITIKASNHIFKHQIGSSSGNDYSFSIDINEK